MAKPTEYEDLSDSELVRLWQDQRDERAFETLVKNYHGLVFGRFNSKVSNSEDAKELTQEAFIKLVNSIDNYSDQGKFSHFLNTIVSTTLIDFYRKSGKDFDENAIRHEVYDDFNSPNSDEGGLGDQLFAEQKVVHLTEECIPRLPTNERLAFLLLHESEFWDFESPLEWSHLATLNGIDKETAWERFESAREALMKGTAANKVDREAMIIFLVWTQAKRPFKASRPLAYFAELLGETDQKLRNWTHSAKKNLDHCLSQYIES